MREGADVASSKLTVQRCNATKKAEESCASVIVHFGWPPEPERRSSGGGGNRNRTVKLRRSSCGVFERDMYLFSVSTTNMVLSCPPAASSLQPPSLTGATGHETFFQPEATTFFHCTATANYCYWCLELLILLLLACLLSYLTLIIELNKEQGTSSGPTKKMEPSP